MAIQKHNPYPEITDYGSAYKNWEPLTLPSGEIVYKIPGHPEAVYNPRLSNSSGRVVIQSTQQIQQQQIALDQQKQDIKAKNQAIANGGVGHQLIPVAAGTAGAVGGAYLINNLAKGPATFSGHIIPAGQPNAGALIYTDGSLHAQGGALIQTATPVAPTPATPGQVAASPPANATTSTSSGAAPTPVGTAPNGGTMISDGSVQTNTLPPGTAATQDGQIVDTSTGEVVGRVAQGAAGAYQIYQGTQEFKTDKVGGSLDIAAGGANVAAAAGVSGASDVAAPLMIAKGGYDGYNAFQHGGTGLRTSTTEIGAGLGSFAGPPGTVAGAVIGNAVGYGLQGHGWKNDAALIAATGGMGVPYVIARRLGFDPLPGLMHKTTRQTAQEHTQDLLGQNTDDKQYQDYVAGQREQFNTGPKDPSKPFGDSKGNQYGSWDEYQKAGLDAANLTGVYGNLKLGPAYTNLTPDQKLAFVQSNIDANNYTSDHGEVIMKDEKKGQELLNGFQLGAQSTQSPGQVAASAPVGRNSLPTQSPIVIARAPSNTTVVR